MQFPSLRLLLQQEGMRSGHEPQKFRQALAYCMAVGITPRHPFSMNPTPAPTSVQPVTMYDVSLPQRDAPPICCIFSNERVLIIPPHK